MGLRALFKREPEPLPAAVVAMGIRHYEQWLDAAVAEGDTDAAVAAERWRESGAVSADDYHRCRLWHCMRLHRICEAGIADGRANHASKEDWEQIRQHVLGLNKEFDAFLRWGHRAWKGKD